MLRQERRLFSLSTGIGLLVISLFCAGCNPAENRYPGYLTLRLSANPTTLDPALITDVTGGSIAAKIFNGLVRFNESLEIVPDLASAWSLAPDQRTYTFHLKRNIHFSNGRELTAGDVRFSFERVLDRRTRAPLTWVLDRIEGATDFMEGRSKRVSGITVLDTRTLR
ncbi:MAG: ABC transporter substrate-binding protein, partial [Nitrospirota bacterium]|nr:ABC transporter substrate-binding protein [Nitrospirota bacterium]